MQKPALIFGIIFAALSVIVGAFAAHALKPMMEPSQQNTFEIGVRYQVYHSFALIALGLLSMHYTSAYFNYATWFFVLGIFCFSGSLYAISLMQMNGIVGLKGIGIITPIGGLLFIIGWLLMLIGVIKAQ